MSKAKPYDSYDVEGYYYNNLTRQRMWKVWCGNIETYERAKQTLENGRSIFEKGFQLRIVGNIREVIEDES
ncbi:hypothetical protein [Burkholderia phage vB_BpP_HN02]|uniref:Uncharacterized protein n=1 Tax=Burkholderia phage vB_BpP_HN02 TaxID=3116925 RepID=A0AAX4JI18_9CAUD